MFKSVLQSLRSTEFHAEVPAGSISNKNRCWLAMLLSLATLLPAGTAFAAADLGIAIETSNATPLAGGAAFSYTITVTNHGPDDAQNIVVLDPMPAAVVVANSNIAVVNNPSTPGYGLVCTAPPVGTNGTVRCQGNLPGAAPSTSVITIVAQIIADTAAGVRTNTATVVSDTQEANPNTNANTASVQQNITVNAPLSVNLTGPVNFVPGDNLVYRMTLNNGGQSTALNATISNPLPAGTSFVSLFGTGALHSGCTHNAGTPGTLSCPAVDIATGLHELTLVLKSSTSAGNLQSTATITNAGTGSIAVGSSTVNSTATP